MSNFWWNVLSVAIGNAISFLIYRGFVDSYWGKNIVEELSRAFNKLSKHWRKEELNKKIERLEFTEKKT